MNEQVKHQGFRMQSGTRNSEQRKHRSERLKRAPIASLIKQMLPVMLLGICGLLVVDTIDSWLIARAGTTHLTALGFTVPITNILFACAIAMSISIKALLSHKISQHQCTPSRQLTTDGLILFILISAVISIFGLMTVSPVFQLLGVDYALIPESFHMGPKPELMPIITPYIQTRYIGFVFWMLPICISAIMRAAGRGKLSGMYLTSWALSTILLDSYFYYSNTFENPLLAIAIGHILSDITFSSIGLMHLIFAENLLKFRGLNLKRFTDQSKRLSIIGLPATVVNLLTPASIFLLTALMSQNGQESVAALGLFFRLEPILLLIPMVMTSILPTIIGHNYAANLHTRIIESVNYSYRLIVVVQSITALIIWLMIDHITNFYQLEEQVAFWFGRALLFLPISLTGYGLFIVTTSALNAMHKPMTAMKLSSIRVFIILLPLVIAGHFVNEINGILIAMMLSNMFAGFLAWKNLKQQGAFERQENVNLE